MGLLTIGAFAQAAQLSPKALRLYDELGLLPPAAVDSEPGYRFYHPDQLEQARLIAWLRRLSMPLARIREVIRLPPKAAAAQVEAFWAEVVAETASREQLATLLVDYLSGRGAAMSSADETWDIRYAARTDAGAVRTSNEDAAYAGTRLLAVADGVGGPTGERASAAAIDALRTVATQAVPAAGVLNALATAAHAARRAVHDIAESAADDGAVTTLTAILWSGSRFALMHIGDTRAYRLRGGELLQLTHDHTYVQSLVDEGRLSPEEAAAHPQQALLARALTGSDGDQPDLSVHDAAAGDRYLLCSDGLTRVVPTEATMAVLARWTSPDEAVEQLIRLVYEGGAPDNIACVVADVVSL